MNRLIVNSIWLPDSIYNVSFIASRISPGVPYINTGPSPGGTVPYGNVLPIMTMGAVYVDGRLPLAIGCVDSEDSMCSSRIVVSVYNVAMFTTGSYS